MTTSSGKRKDAPDPVRRSKRQKAQPAPQLNSLTVTWAPDTNLAAEFRFHITIVATLSSSTGVTINQEFCDGLSIQAGTNPGNVEYYMTLFLADKNGSNISSTTTVTYDDYPGYYDGDFGFQANTNLKYVFGAQWRVMWRGRTLATTTPLFGTITGTGPARTFTPAASVTATWNTGTSTWQNRGALVEAFPAWGTYPVPPVNNTMVEEDSDSE